MTTSAPRWNTTIPGAGDAGPAWADGGNGYTDNLKRSHDLSPFFPGRPASGSASGKDKTAVLGAITAALAQPTGGQVMLGDGVYDLGDGQILYPDFVGSGKTLMLKGQAGSAGTILKRSADGLAGTHFVTHTGADTGRFLNLLEDITFVGPGTRGAIGTSPATMDGILLGSGIKVNRCNVSGFRSGMVFAGDHITINNPTIQDCYYGMYWIVSTTNGDVVIENPQNNSNLWASIAVSSGGLATFHCKKGHLGFGPYAMYIESGAGAGLSMGGVVFDGTSVEAVGNSVLYSEDQAARVNGIQFNRCGFGRGFATYGIAARTANPSIRLAELINAEFNGGMPIAAADGGVFDVTSTLTVEVTGTWKSSYDAAAAAGVAFINAPANSVTAEVDLNERRVMRAFGAQAFGAAPITAGMVLEKDIFNRVRPYGYYFATTGARTAIAGIALNGVAAASREQCIVVTKGRNIPVLSSGAVASANTLVPSITVVGKATGVVYDGTATSAGNRPVIGHAYAGAAIPTTAATFGVEVDIGRN